MGSSWHAYVGNGACRWTELGRNGQTLLGEKKGAFDVW